MRIALRTLLVAYVLAVIVWCVALFPRLVVHGGDLGTAMVFVTAFCLSQIILALLFLASATAAAFTLRTSAARSVSSFLVFALAVLSFLATSWYCYFFFHG